MDNEEFKYCCSYLVHLLTGQCRWLPGVRSQAVLVMGCVLQYQIWLDKNCVKNQAHDYRWSTATAGVYHDHDLGQYIQFSRDLCFKYPEDLVAFQLRWGIHE